MARKNSLEHAISTPIEQDQTSLTAKEQILRGLANSTIRLGGEFAMNQLDKRVLKVALKLADGDPRRLYANDTDDISVLNVDLFPVNILQASDSEST